MDIDLLPRERQLLLEAAVRRNQRLAEAQRDLEEIERLATVIVARAGGDPNGHYDINQDCTKLLRRPDSPAPAA